MGRATVPELPFLFGGLDDLFHLLAIELRLAGRHLVIGDDRQLSPRKLLQVPLDLASHPTVKIAGGVADHDHRLRPAPFGKRRLLGQRGLCRKERPGRRGNRRPHAALRDLDLRSPQDGVQCQPAKIVVLEARMVMRAGAGKGAAAVGSLAGPGDDLSFRPVRREHRREQRRDALVAGTKEDPAIKLLLGEFHRLHAAADRVLWGSQSEADIASHRVQRIADLLVPAKPVEEMLLDVVLDGGGRVETYQSDALLHQLVKLLHPVGMAAADQVRIPSFPHHDNRGGAVQLAGVFRPGIEIDLRLERRNIGHTFQAFFQ